MQAFEIIRLAKKASFVWEELSPVERMMIYQFADLVAAAEREACAKVCDDLLANPHTGGGWSDAMIEAAAAIRARGQQ